MPQHRELGMLTDKDVELPLKDGSHLSANVFRPADGDGPWPVILNFSPYGKDVHFSQFMPSVWEAPRTSPPCSRGRAPVTSIVTEPAKAGS